jgi:hypothetical protein
MAYDKKNQNQGSEKPKKNTGCKAGVGKDSGNRWVSGWNFQKRRGMLTFIAGPYGETSVHKGDEYDWENWIAEYSLNGIPQGIMPVLYCLGTGKVIFKKLQMVANPKAPNGGYFGQFKKA